MDCKIKIKLGEIEVEYEGSEAFLKLELPDLIRMGANLYEATNPKGPADLADQGKTGFAE
jgi:hypothetical protein